MKHADVNKIVNQVIPPNDYQHRNGFSNEHIIDNLSDEEKFKLEAELINILQQKRDMLIVETLSYLKSEKALPILYNLLDNLDDEMEKIITTISIYELNHDQKMIDIAKSAFLNISDKFQLIAAFPYLVRFQDSGLTKQIQEFTFNSDYLVSYNAKKVLGQ